MNGIGEIINFITSGSIQGLPPLVVMAVPLIVGLIIGYLIKKVLKFAVILGLIVVVLAYFGLFNLSFGSLTDLISKYGTTIVHYATLIIGILPLSVGFIIGLIIGFILS